VDQILSFLVSPAGIWTITAVIGVIAAVTAFIVVFWVRRKLQNSPQPFEEAIAMLKSDLIVIVAFFTIEFVAIVVVVGAELNLLTGDVIAWGLVLMNVLTVAASLHETTKALRLLQKND
jgi:hypothetical protein